MYVMLFHVLCICTHACEWHLMLACYKHLQQKRQGSILVFPFLWLWYCLCVVSSGHTHTHTQTPLLVRAAMSPGVSPRSLWISTSAPNTIRALIRSIWSIWGPQPKHTQEETQTFAALISMLYTSPHVQLSPVHTNGDHQKPKEFSRNQRCPYINRGNKKSPKTTQNH